MLEKMNNTFTARFDSMDVLLNKVTKDNEELRLAQSLKLKHHQLQ
jgi:hypothetical protein